MQLSALAKIIGAEAQNILMPHPGLKAGAINLQPLLNGVFCDEGSRSISANHRKPGQLLPIYC